MNTPFLNELVQLHRDDLARDAEHAHRARGLERTNFLTRIGAKWRRPSPDAEPQPHVRPVAIAR
jgi:hypothetical protein